MSKTAATVAPKTNETVAVRAAHMFDNAKDTVIADLSKPIEKSKGKQSAVVLGLVGIGVAIGASI